jgi:transketolase
MNSLSPKLFDKNIDQEPIRAGFGRGLKEAGADDRIVALCADLTESTQMHHFAEAYPERFIEIGIAEQNLVTVGAGLALAGKIPFVSSYAAFSPGRNWEQIRTTVCLNQTNVKIVGSHAGVSVGPDGATHQMLEDIALMRVLPNMTVVVPCDSLEAERATLAIAKSDGGTYLRLARDKSPIITTSQTPFELGQAQIFREGKDATVVACGPLVYHSLMAAQQLSKQGIEVEVINCATIKPLDSATILASAKKTGVVLTIEEAQAAGGLGGAVAELLGDQLPLPLTRMGMADHFGESGDPTQLLEHFGLTAPFIVKKVEALIKRKAKR